MYYRGWYCIDGGFSNNTPLLDDRTFCVSPFIGRVVLCGASQLVFSFFGSVDHSCSTDAVRRRATSERTGVSIQCYGIAQVWTAK